ncbi:hypothetical protein LZ31DRAFT_104675 [Colletotrichum somersetense]|nr:hypothetical protein LZ31DRAFT_104675 [Colletotrichum somersetense]
MYIRNPPAGSEEGPPIHHGSRPRTSDHRPSTAVRLRALPQLAHPQSSAVIRSSAASNSQPPLRDPCQRLAFSRGPRSPWVPDDGNSGTRHPEPAERKTNNKRIMPRKAKISAYTTGTNSHRCNKRALFSHLYQIVTQGSRNFPVCFLLPQSCPKYIVYHTGRCLGINPGYLQPAACHPSTMGLPK